MSDPDPWELEREVPTSDEDRKRGQIQRIAVGVIALVVIAGLLYATISGLFV